jgi:hypothetical protein
LNRTPPAPPHSLRNNKQQQGVSLGLVDELEGWNDIAKIRILLKLLTDDDGHQTRPAKIENSQRNNKNSPEAPSHGAPPFQQLAISLSSTKSSCELWLFLPASPTVKRLFFRNLNFRIQTFPR